MAIISKELFYEHVCTETPCSVLHLWSSNCVDGITSVAIHVFFGSIKFFGPIFTLKLLLNWKKISPKYLLSQAFAYARTVAYGVTFSILLFGSLCLFLFYPTRSLLEEYPSTTSSPQSHCSHKKSCFDYGYKGSFKFFCMGYLLEFIKNILPRTGRIFSRPKILSQMLFSRRNVLFGLFFGSYVFLYRQIGCYLRKKNGKELPIHSVIAGLLAGSTYYLKPNRQIPIIGFTTILQVQRLIP
ncbi:hypothetical protein MML48_6g00001697 [Holotrichia oblita]|uniref:Uncharacterized protein n=1 Tax=Holotrichia oblita TaxID=644536 RepID=A0ACB9SX65_HOLOL|nr:hypothetical protein MML48_6g00001697 [Holotrichia oblita]